MRHGGSARASSEFCVRRHSMECAFPKFCYQLLFDPRSKALIHNQVTIITNVSLQQLLRSAVRNRKLGVGHVYRFLFKIKMS